MPNTKPLPKNLEGKKISIVIQEVEETAIKKRRQRGSIKGKIWLWSDKNNF